MKAITIASFGGVEGLEVREVSDAPPATLDRVRVRVRAAGLNRADILQRLGRYPAPPGYPQDIPGIEFAGEVSEVGKEVRLWKIGDRVFGIIGGGGQAQYVTVPENHLAAVPSNLDWAEAAGVPEVFMTAHDALFTQCGLTIGERVLIHAAGSGNSWTKERGVDVVLDLVGAAYLEANLAALAMKGRLIFVGTTSGSKSEIDFSVAMHKRLRIMGTSLRTRSLEEKATATRLFAEQVVPLLQSTAVRPVIDRVFPMEEVRAAHQRIESNDSFGKVVLLID